MARVHNFKEILENQELCVDCRCVPQRQVDASPFHPGRLAGNPQRRKSVHQDIDVPQPGNDAQIHDLCISGTRVASVHDKLVDIIIHSGKIESVKSIAKSQTIATQFLLLMTTDN